MWWYVGLVSYFKDKCQLIYNGFCKFCISLWVLSWFHCGFKVLEPKFPNCWLSSTSFIRVSSTVNYTRDLFQESTNSLSSFVVHIKDSWFVQYWNPLIPTSIWLQQKILRCIVWCNFHIFPCYIVCPKPSMFDKMTIILGDLSGNSRGVHMWEWTLP